MNFNAILFLKQSLSKFVMVSTLGQLIADTLWHSTIWAVGNQSCEGVTAPKISYINIHTHARTLTGLLLWRLLKKFLGKFWWQCCYMMTHCYWHWQWHFLGYWDWPEHFRTPHNVLSTDHHFPKSQYLKDRTLCIDLLKTRWLIIIYSYWWSQHLHKDTAL